MKNFNTSLPVLCLPLLTDAATLMSRKRDCWSP
jgi:hypothetical protein